MTDHKFTDDEVMKALEVHSDTEDACLNRCPYSGDRYCGSKMARDALALINRQKVEIESLKIANEKMYSANKEQEAEIEKLKGQKRVLVLFWKEENKKLKAAKAEAIKEFAERLKANMSNIARMEYGGYTYFCVGYDLIDTLVKEMTEGQS